MSIDANEQDVKTLEAVVAGAKKYLAAGEQVAVARVRRDLTGFLNSKFDDATIIAKLQA